MHLNPCHVNKQLQRLNYRVRPYDGSQKRGWLAWPEDVMRLGWVLKGKYGLPRQMRRSDGEEQEQRTKGPGEIR